LKTTRTSLEQAQQALADALTAERGAAPLIFAAEDFIACLLIADSLPPATAERWFPATVRTLVHWQDADGGLKTDVHVTCKMPGEVGDRPERCTCEKFFGGFGGQSRAIREARRGQVGNSKEPAVERQYCPDHKSFSSRDRVFCTAAAVATILADTPYRAGMFKGITKPATR